jgi:membrane fusion protein, multidrug efflux system
LTGCSLGSDEKQAPKTQVVAPITVSTYKIVPKDISVSLEYPAKIKSVKQVNVVARVSGILENKYFTEGSYVKEGDLLYKIDSSRYEASMNEAQAQKEVEDANLKVATRNWDRTRKLFEQNAISEKERDEALSSYETAQASLKLAQATLKKAQIDFNYTKVKATVSGMTSFNTQDIGSYVGNDSDTMTLTTITQIDPIYAEFSLPDIDLLRKRYGLNNGTWNDISQAKLAVHIIMPDNSEYKEVGSLDFLDSFVDNETSTIKARATFKNKDNTLITGLFVRVNIDGLIYKNAITIPQKALLQDALGSYVLVAKDGKVTKVDVRVGSVHEDKYIIESGLNTDDMVITNNLTKLRSGSAITIVSDKE